MSLESLKISKGVLNAEKH